MTSKTPIHTCQHDPQPSSGCDYPPQSIELAAAMCKALSDPARLRLLLWLAPGERCVSELVELEEEKLSNVSARLQILSNARLVIRRRESKHVYYALADEHVRSLLQNVVHHAAETVS